MPSDDGSELLNINKLFNRAKAKGIARLEAIERGEILNEPTEIQPLRKRLANILREQGLTSTALPPTHPPYKPHPTMANMLVKQGRTATRNARAATAAANMLVKQERMAAATRPAARSRIPVIGGTRRHRRKQRNSRKRTTRKA